MIKSNKVIEKIIYTLDEEDKKALRRIYNLLDEIHWDMSMEETVDVNGDDTIRFDFEEISTLYKKLEELLEVDFLTLIRE